jgi:hypothetical protein
MQDAAESAPGESVPEEVDAAQAFEDLRAEVSVLRRAVEALPEEWEAKQPPDYTVSLGAIAKGLAGVAGRLDAIERHPALRMTPEQHQQAIAQASSGLMREAVASFYQATKAAERERDELAGMIGAARAQDKQLKWLLWTAGIALLFGLLVSPVFARLLPFGLDGRVAAYILQADRWGAGAALMQAGNPQAWRGMMDEHNLVQSNREALAVCRTTAAQAKKEQRCTVIVPVP